VGLFASTSASQRDIIIELHALIFHEVPSGQHCEGCLQQNTVTKCPGCDVRFCSQSCCHRATALWHGAACGNTAATRAENFCEGRTSINGIKVGTPWRAGMGGFKMMLSLVLAAREGMGSFRNLMSKYQQITAFNGDAELIETVKAGHMDRARALWTCWEQFLKSEPASSWKLLDEEASLKFDTFLNMIVKYNHANQEGGLYYETSFCSHSCRPNVAIKPLGEGGPLRLFAVRPLAPGDELTMTFVNPEMKRSQRRAQLSQQYGIECRCARCMSDGDIPQEELALLMNGGEACCLM